MSIYFAKLETLGQITYMQPKMVNIPLKIRGVDGRIILKWTLRSIVGDCGLDSSGSGQGYVVGSSDKKALNLKVPHEVGR
jgi:hypothetical protein